MKPTIEQIDEALTATEKGYNHDMLWWDELGEDAPENSMTEAIKAMRDQLLREVEDGKTI